MEVCVRSDTCGTITPVRQDIFGLDDPEPRHGVPTRVRIIRTPNARSGGSPRRIFPAVRDRYDHTSQTFGVGGEIQWQYSGSGYTDIAVAGTHNRTQPRKADVFLAQKYFTDEVK